MLTTRESGLIVPRQAAEAADERAIEQELQRIRPDVALQSRPLDEHRGGTLVYKVVHVPTGQVIFTWIDDQMRPLPLSSRILDEFQRHQLGARNTGLIDADEHNRRHLDQLERERREHVQAVRDDHQARLEDVTSVSMSGRHRPRRRGDSPDGPRANGRWKRKP